MPERFGRYWLHEMIGRGGMAEIFRATIGPDPESHAFDLALKRMRPEMERDRMQLDMFTTEADVGKLLRHPNLVRVYDVGLADGRPYIVMEHVWGHDLSRLISMLRLRKLRFPSDLAAFLAMQLLRALDYLHRATTPAGEPMYLVHRDVTPSNIFVTFNGTVKLGDLGIARVSFLEPHPSETGGVVVKGKVGYMPPEILEGEPVEQGADLWGVAATLYEMLTSRGIYEGAKEAEILAGMPLPAIPPVRAVNPQVDARLAAIVDRALSLKIKQRPHDAVSFYRELKVYLSSQGISVDGKELARFACEVSGVNPVRQAARAQPSAADFKLPEYQVPLEMSPTRRIELLRAKHRRLWPVVVVAGGLALAAAAYGTYALLNHGDAAPSAAGTREGAVVEQPSGGS